MSENDNNVRVVFEPPSKESPGFLRRNKQAMVFQIKMADLQKKKPSEWTLDDANLFDEMIDFLVPYIVEPADPDEARELLWDASEEDFNTMFSAVGGGESNPTEPAGTEYGNTKEKSSASTTKA